ncbi:MAG: glycosyltransferase [Gemmobacter sp.]
METEEQLAERIAILERSGMVQDDWYCRRYPDVPASGLAPAAHYMKIGAALGRDPGPEFDTRGYLAAYRHVAQAGMNPLLHYILHGRAHGYAPRPDNERDALRMVRMLRGRLLDLGFTEQPLADLDRLARTDPDPLCRAHAAREIALWHMRSRTPEGWRTALGHIAAARAAGAVGAPAEALNERLATLEMLCRHHLGQRTEAEAAFHRARRAGEIAEDGFLARANLEADPAMRLAWINLALRQDGIAPLALIPGQGPAYDRLTSAARLGSVTQGPLVTVLVAAHQAAGTIDTALRALREQTWRALEILVIDDASRDGTCNAVLRQSAHDPRIRLIRMPTNRGAYVARNRGLAEAAGEFVTLHDADDWAHPERIARQVRHLLDHPGLIACTSRQARAGDDLSFTRWTGDGRFLIQNISSLMFRRAPVQDRLGCWDTVRFSADSELIRRMQRAWGNGAVANLGTGPLAFQRDSADSAVADDALGINGFLFGARKEYRDAQRLAHRDPDRLRYDGRISPRPFPAPAIMRADRPAPGTVRHFPVVLASEFRMPGGSVLSCAEELRAQRRAGIRTGVFEMYRYDLFRSPRLHMLDELRAEIDGETVEPIVYGERVRCDLLILRYPPILQHRHRYLPEVEAAEIKVIVNQPPRSDYGADGVMRYDIPTCAANLRAQFGRDAVWHPIGPLVREALHRHHAADLRAIRLSDEDWLNIIDLSDWDTGPRPARSGALRIGRHGRDNPLKWPDRKADILAAWPEDPGTEVHVLGGADGAAAVLGGRLPGNWTVHPFGAMPVRDFLAGIDAFVYFAHPGWVESFGRTIIEAMAAGVPVVLSENYRPLFGDAALYATPQTAVATVRRLLADPAATAAQVARARQHLAERYGHGMHIARLRAAGVRG